MTVSIRTGACIAGFAAMLCCGPALAGLDDGLAALARGDYAAAAKELRPLAERGDAEAQYRIGRMYEFGAGFPADKAQGIAWYRKAAAQGHAAAQQELGALYASGDGVPKDDAQALAWFRKAADQGNPTAQYNLGLLYAKGAGVRVDNAQAIAWFRKSAAQGFAAAQFKLGLAYEYGEGVAKDPAVAYANYAIAARGGNPEFVKQRDALAARLSAAQAQQALAAANAWVVGQPMPTSVAAPAPDRCLASGQMEGEKFTAAHCAVSFMGDQRSVAIWFNEEPITPQERESFQTSSYADGNRGGKPRTMVQVMFCPGVKAIDFNSNHAKSAMAGLQRVFESPGDFKVERMTGEFRPGAPLSGKIVGSRGKTSWNLDFAVTLPLKDAAAGMSCGK
ncbi:MAG: tetratricopeptide repeat protein [Burkholderiales bacterium]